MRNRFIVPFLLSSILASASTLAAEEDEALQFHVIKDGSTKHISMIPAKGFNRDGKIRSNYNPNSVVYQHAALMENLREEQAELDRQAAEAAMAELEKERLAAEQENNEPPSIIKRSRQDGNVFFGRADRGVLDELIQLEKRAGRSKAE